MKNLLILLLVLGSANINAQVPAFKIKDNPYNKPSVTTRESISKIAKDSMSIANLMTKKKENITDYQKILESLNKIDKGEVQKNISDINDLEDNKIILSNSIIKLTRKIDELANETEKELMSSKKWNVILIERKSKAFFDLVYGEENGKIHVLQNTGFSFGKKTGSVYSELVSGYLSAFRVSFGSMISSSSSETQKNEEEALQKLAANGGNTMLTFEYPLFYLHSSNNLYNIISKLNAKGTADFPEFGTETKEWAGSALLGIDVYADAALSNNKMRFFGLFNANLIHGTDEFKTNLAIGANDFIFGQLILGIVLNENIKLSFSVATFSSQPSLRHRKVVIGGQILPQG
jgi:hypothetical protein